MRAQHHYSGKANQRGAALLIMLVIMVMGATTFLVSSLSTSALKTAHQGTSALSLAQARDALIGYAITYGDTHAGKVHGYLPCPDPNGESGANGEGSSETCGSKNVSTIGRLPWKTLGLPPLRDSNNECLWYAVAGTYKNNPMTDMMNWDTKGLFEILDSNGTVIAQNVVAVVFAPGSTLNSQSRASDGSAPLCGGNYTAASYLDNDGTINNASVSGTANDITQFRLGTSDLANDQIIYITRDDIFNAQNIRSKLLAMTSKAAECIADYGRRNNAGSGDKRLPWSGRLRSPTTEYWTDSNYDDENSRLDGRLPNRVNTSDGTTNNLIVDTWYQLNSSGSNCPSVTDWATYSPWWTNWKDHLFYALADNFKPSSSSSTPACTGNCLTVNGAGTYAAVVMFAGKTLSGQSRAAAADHLDFANYLEGINNITLYPNTGSSDYLSGAETSSFNDVLYCINPDLSVTAC